MSSSGSSKNQNAESGDYIKIDWNPPGSDQGDSITTKNATLALKTAIAVARAFDANCALRNPAKECTVPMFEPQELVVGEPIRSSGFFTDIQLRGIKLTKNLIHGEFSEDEQEFRERFAERSIDGHYAIKFLQKGIYNSVHAASAASDMMMETKILMNLAPHPNIQQIYGVTAAGSDAFLSQGKNGFYIILDSLRGTMIQRINEWRTQQQEDIATRQAKGEDDKAIGMGLYQKLMQRLEVALDVGSALLFLSDRQIVFHLRPDKVGFDVRYGRIKLCDFGQARENGQLDQAPSLTKTDDIRTLAYTAPETLCQAPVTVAADVYAYGVVLWEMLTLRRPFEDMGRSEHFQQVILGGKRPTLSDDIPKSVQDLIAKCWDPDLRPTMKKVYDTVEEILLFQDDKPQIPTFTRASSADDVMGKLNASANQETAESSKAAKRPLRRTKTEEGVFRHKKEQEKPPRRSTRKEHHHKSGSAHGHSEPSLKDKSKSSNHERSGGSSSKIRRKSRKDKPKESGNGESMKEDGSMQDESKMFDQSKDSVGSVGMKDKSRKDRVSRSRSGKKEEPAAEDKTAEAETSQLEGDAT